MFCKDVRYVGLNKDFVEWEYIDSNIVVYFSFDESLFELSTEALKFFWKQLDGTKKMADIYAGMLNEFEVEPEQLSKDIERLMEILVLKKSLSFSKSPLN